MALTEVQVMSAVAFLTCSLGLTFRWPVPSSPWCCGCSATGVAVSSPLLSASERSLPFLPEMRLPLPAALSSLTMLPVRSPGPGLGSALPPCGLAENWEAFTRHLCLWGVPEEPSHLQKELIVSATRGSDRGWKGGCLSTQPHPEQKASPSSDSLSNTHILN